MAVVEYGMIGEKVGMTRIFSENGSSFPVTVIKCGPCFVVQKKTKEKDGYEALQLGYDQTKEKKLNKPTLGHLKKANVPALRELAEFRFKETDKYEVGQTLKVEGFKVGDKVDVSGKSKGKGFAGVVKRLGYHGGSATHGSMFHRRPGSVGATDPERVFKGKGLPGRMGNEKVTVKNLEVVGIREERDLLLVKGAVPGSSGTTVIIRKKSS